MKRVLVHNVADVNESRGGRGGGRMERGRGSSRSSDIRELIRPRGETSLWFLTDQPKVPRGASTVDSGDGTKKE